VRRPLVVVIGFTLAFTLAPAASGEAAASRGDKVWVLGADGRARVRHDRFVPARADLQPVPRAPARRKANARAAAAGAPGALPEPGAPRGGVPDVLAALRDRGEIDPAQHDAWRKAWADSYRTLKKLKGTRRTQLYAVRENVALLAQGRLLTASRAPLAFLTLEHNRQWWASAPIPPSGQRVEFGESELVWQMYPGQGLQLQWLGTFGKANALWKSRKRARLRTLLDEAVALAAARAGGIAFDYQFPFGGGRPPWASGMAQATGMQALSRASVLLNEPAYADAARAAAGIFSVKPPEGVRVATTAGAHYVIYSFAPWLRVLNAFTQTVDGLHDFARLTGDGGGQKLFDAGEAELRATLRSWDTGAWSLYSLQGAESDLNYHTIARDFLQGLCDRLTLDLSTDVAAPDPAPYCQAAGRFSKYLQQPPRVKVARSRPVKGRRSSVAFTISKVSSVTVTMRRRGAVVYRSVLRLGRGRHAVTIVPRERAPLAVAVRAVDLAGNAAEATRTLTVKAPPKKRRK
jgi:hypothetical protein